MNSNNYSSWSGAAQVAFVRIVRVRKRERERERRHKQQHRWFLSQVRVASQALHETIPKLPSENEERERERERGREEARSLHRKEANSREKKEAEHEKA